MIIMIINDHQWSSMIIMINYQMPATRTKYGKMIMTWGHSFLSLPLFGGWDWWDCEGMVEVDTDLQTSRHSQFWFMLVSHIKNFFFRNQLGIHPKMGEGIWADLMLKCLGLCLESLSEIGMHINKPVEGYHERFRAVFIARWPRWPVLCVFVTSTIADIATMAAKAATSSHISFHHNLWIHMYNYIYICTYHFSYGCKFVYLKGTETVSGFPPQASLHITMNDVLNCRSSDKEGPIEGPFSGTNHTGPRTQRT